MKKNKIRKKRERAISLYSLKSEEALTAFMQIDKKKLLKAEKEIKVG